jgi:hypothetical protein
LSDHPLYAGLLGTNLAGIGHVFLGSSAATWADIRSAKGMPGSEEDPWMKLDRITLENYAAGRPRDFPNLGAARVELLRRDSEYAEEQERSRREYESDRDLKRQQFETALADKQLAAAIAVAKATKLAAWAAGFSAAGAVVTAIVEIIRLLAWT